MESRGAHLAAGREAVHEPTDDVPPQDPAANEISIAATWNHSRHRQRVVLVPSANVFVRKFDICHVRASDDADLSSGQTSPTMPTHEECR